MAFTTKGCQGIRGLIDVYRTLSPAEKALVDEHLERCEDCRTWKKARYPDPEKVRLIIKGRNQRNAHIWVYYGSALDTKEGQDAKFLGLIEVIGGRLFLHIPKDQVVTFKTTGA